MTILGLAKLNRKLAKLPAAAEKRIKEAMGQGADEIVALMKSLVAVDSGELRDSIGWTWGDAPKYSQKIATVKSADGKLVITIYAGNSKVRYAHLVEFATKAHENAGQFPGTQHPGTNDAARACSALARSRAAFAASTSEAIFVLVDATAALFA